MKVRVDVLLQAKDMEQVFKFWYEAYIFSLLPKFGLSWKQEIKQINELWEAAGALIDKFELCSSFHNECRELHINSEGFNFDLAFRKADTTWRSEIMTSVVNRIIKFWDDDVPLNSEPARWTGNEIVIDNTVCKKFASKRKHSETLTNNSKRVRSE